MDPQTQLAFQFANDLSKQLITLSTGILALSITFTKNLFSEVPVGCRRPLMIAWVCYLLAIVFGVWHMMALTGLLAPASGTCETVLSIGGNARFPAALQILAFLTATILIIIYGVRCFRAKPDE